jgi:hypothetical protein
LCCGSKPQRLAVFGPPFDRQASALILKSKI